MKKELVYLTGFMAAGKSTVGPIVANTIGWDFADIDKVIEQNEQMKINEIFKNKGEDYFRKVERDTLIQLSRLQNYIIALGGGTIADDVNLEIIKNSGKLIYLKSSPEAAYNRLRFKRDRPALLFEGDEEPAREHFIERITDLLSKREKYYRQADYIINTDNIPVGKTVDKIASIIIKGFIRWN